MGPIRRFLGGVSGEQEAVPSVGPVSADEKEGREANEQEKLIVDSD